MNKKKVKISSSIDRKKGKTSSNNNNKKESQTKPKPVLNKSVDKRKKIGLNLTTEPGLNNSTVEAKYQKDKIHLTKQRKDKVGSQKSLNSRSSKSTRGKEYENTLNKLDEDYDYNPKETKLEKEYDFFNFKMPNDENKKKDKNKSKSSKNNKDEDSKKNQKNSKLVGFKEEKKDKKKNKNNLYDNQNESDEEEEEEKDDDFIHRTLYRKSLEGNGKELKDNKNEIQNIQKNKDKENIKKNKEQSNTSNTRTPDKFGISMEKTDDIRYNIDDKKIYSNLFNNSNNQKYKTEFKEDSDEKNSNDYYSKNDKKNIYSPKNVSFSKLINERTVDFFVIDTDDDNLVVSTKYKKKIDRKRNKFKEIYIEKYDSATPIKNDKLTGFVLIRKNKGKKIYDLYLEDDIDEINTILRDKEVMIKREIIQFIPLDIMLNYEREQKEFNDKIIKKERL